MNEKLKLKIDKTLFLKKKIKLRIDNFSEELFIKRRITFLNKGKKIKNKEITIISNSCLAADICYQYGLEPFSFLERAFIKPLEYIKFLSNLEYYLLSEPKIICDKKFYIIIKLDDIYIYYLHAEIIPHIYKKNTMHYNNLFILFNMQYNDREEDEIKVLKLFQKLPYKNKIFITGNYKLQNEKNVFYIKNLSGSNIYTRYVKNNNLVQLSDCIDFVRWFNGEKITA